MTKKLTFDYRIAETSDADRIVQFLLAHFIFEEPCIRAMNSDAVEWKPILTEIVAASLEHPFSTLVLTWNGDVAAVLLHSVWRRNDAPREDHDVSRYSEKTRKFMEVLQKCHDDFWPLAPEDVDVVLYREISSVAKPWQRQGIASKMLTFPLRRQQLDDYNVGGVVSATSSFANQQLLAKRGFRCLKEFPYADITSSSSHGRRLLETDDGSQALRINFKPIDEFDLHVA